MNRYAALILFAVIGQGLTLAQKYEVSPLGAYMRFGHSALGSIWAEDPGDKDTTIKLRTGIGGRLTYNQWNYFGHEVGYIRYTGDVTTTVRPTGAPPEGLKLTDSAQITLGSYNFLVYMMPRGERFRPYFTGGVQMYKYADAHFGEYGDMMGGTTYGANYGGGLKIRLFKHAQLRVDARDYIGGKPYDLKFKVPSDSGGIVHTLEGSVGLGITF